MAVHRYIQNFSHRNAILISDDTRLGATLSPVLGRLGLIVNENSMAEAPLEWSAEDLDASRDVVLIDGDLLRMPFIPRLKSDGLTPLVPVIGLVGMQAPSRLKTLMQLGATAFIPKPIHSGAVYSALYLAINEHARKAAQAEVIKAQEQRRHQRRFVIKAVLEVMRERGCDDEAAFAHLRNQSMHARVSIETYCQFVVQRSAARPECGSEPPQQLRSAD
ncbi:ANTAR domain-containing protein [Jiella sp. MQZ9-1]|uniref:ANTAR domain-containing protein n=1 Tax=Jiella flava TaxID=2816857 RepID=A0A939JS10_9HYPH|nr:ANTAR domain-containing protein [Jiella flava]MBO0662478.1 ANTAR domain-containing protein [Jiella flava]MCD2471703.1 ANTAR domain-containing protein [Jiella flava]